jgi:DNA-binding response OmpR family regulator
MNGPELVRRLAPRRAEARVLYVSGYTEDAMAHVQLGEHEAFLSKPLTSTALCGRLRALLRGVSAPTAHGRVPAPAAQGELQRPA